MYKVSINLFIVSFTCLVNDYPCHKAASCGNLRLLSMLIMDGHYTINQQDATGSTPAHKGQQTSLAMAYLIFNSVLCLI